MKIIDKIWEMEEEVTVRALAEMEESGDILAMLSTVMYLEQIQERTLEMQGDLKSAQKEFKNWGVVVSAQGQPVVVFDEEVCYFPINNMFITIAEMDRMNQSKNPEAEMEEFMSKHAQ